MSEQHFFTLAGLNDKQASQKISSYQSIEGIVERSSANYPRTFVDHNGNISVKPDFNRLDYDQFRPSEAMPRTRERILDLCLRAYKRVGIVKNIIDLMGDFTIQGIRLEYKGTSSENDVWQDWWKKVNGVSFSERFANLFYKCGNNYVYRTNAKLKSSPIPGITVAANTKIPWGYTLLNPVSVKTQYSLGSVKYVLNLGEMDSFVDRTIDTLPQEFKTYLASGNNEVQLPSENVRVFHYKKDDWESFAYPMIYCIIDDLIMLEKLKLADMAALDGIISNVRLWSLGIIDTNNIQNSILPTRKGLDNLKNILATHSGGGPIDLVWGPELKFTESQTQSWRFLGQEKYKITLDSIYDGLGISSVLRSGSNSDSTKNFVSLKTLIERLEYGRKVIVDFWTQEIELVQKSLGLRYPAEIVFDEMVFSDEFAQKKLMVELLDRDVISLETAQTFFKRPHGIEKVRLRREKGKRGKSLPEKAGPYHNPQQDHELRKIALTGGTVTPSEVGLELEDKKKGEKNALEMKAKQEKQYKPVGKPTDGRPRGIIETNKRKPKKDIKTVAKMVGWASSALSKIDSVITPAILETYSKKNKRELTNAEQHDFDKLKVGVLFNIEPLSKVNEETVKAAVLAPIIFPLEFDELFIAAVADFIETNESEPTFEDMKMLRASIYTTIKMKEISNG